MSFILTDYVDPPTLTGAVREALYDAEENRFRLSSWLPSSTINDVNYKYLKGGAGLAEAAVYRSFDAESPIGRREGISQVMGALPPISEKLPLGEYDQIKLRNLGSAEVLPFIARDAERLARNIGARLELARGDALFNGSVTINENGVQQTVSFGRTSSHAVTAGVTWDTYATATPLDDLEAWLETYNNTNGELPATILMPRSVFSHLRRCDQVKGQVFPLSSSPPLTSGEQVRGVLSSLDIPPIELYDAQVRLNGSGTRVTPDDKILFLPGSSDDLGGVLHGVTLESQEPEYGLAGDEAGLVAAQWKTKDPVRVWTHAVTIALPVLKNPDLTFVATVV